MPLYQVGKFFYVPGRLDKVKKPRMYASLAVVAAIVAAVLFVPLPHSVMVTLEVEPRDAVPVWVDVAGGGRLVKVYVKPGQHVTKGQPLADLQNVDLEMDIEKYEGERLAPRPNCGTCNGKVSATARPPTRSPRSQKALESVENQLKEKRRDQQRLHLLAPCDGTVLPPPAVTAHDDPEGQLPSWSGTPLDPQNLGAYLREGPRNESVMFCQIGDPKAAAGEPGDRPGRDRSTSARARRSTSSWTSCRTRRCGPRSSRSPSTELKVTPHLLSTKAGGSWRRTTDPQSGIERPQSTSYEAHAPAGRHGRHHAAGSARPGEDPCRLAALGDAALAAGDAHVQFQAVISGAGDRGSGAGDGTTEH